MSVFVAIFLGIIQGLTEFLPVSSSGHLVLFQKIFGINTDCLMFDIVVHLGTLVAVFLVFRKSIFDMIKHPFCEISKKLVVATIPTILLPFFTARAIWKTGVLLLSRTTSSMYLSSPSFSCMIAS